jgi:hypothetical protein
MRSQLYARSPTVALVSPCDHGPGVGVIFEEAEPSVLVDIDLKLQM